MNVSLQCSISFLTSLYFTVVTVENMYRDHSTLMFMIEQTSFTDTSWFVLRYKLEPCCKMLPIEFTCQLGQHVAIRVIKSSRTFLGGINFYIVIGVLWLLKIHYTFLRSCSGRWHYHFDSWSYFNFLQYFFFSFNLKMALLAPHICGK